MRKRDHVAGFVLVDSRKAHAEFHIEGFLLVGLNLHASRDGGALDVEVGLLGVVQDRTVETGCPGGAEKVFWRQPLGAFIRRVELKIKAVFGGFDGARAPALGNRFGNL